MKRILIAACVLMLSASAFAQKQPLLTAPIMPMDKETNLVSYTGVVDESGVTKSELYKRAMKWIKEFYPNPAGVIQESDTVNWKITGKAKFDCKRTLKDGKTAISDRVQYTISLLFKDGKYKYEVTKINIQAASYVPIEKYFDENAENSQDHFNSLNQADEFFLSLVHSLKQRMDQPSEKVKKDDW